MVENTDNTENVQNYFVGIDGSDASEDAFQVVMNGLRRPCDTVTAAHVHDCRKDFLPYNMKPHYIREVYTCKLMILGDKGHYAASEFTGGGDTNTKSEVMKLAVEQKATIMVTGMHGRKGPKADPTICGTTVDHLSKNASVPIVIIKDPRPRQIKTESKYRFAVCFDGSMKAAKALRTVLGMMRADDNLVIITVRQSDIQMESIESSVSSICTEFGINSQTFKVIDREGQALTNVYKCIQGYLIDESNADNYIDFVAVGNVGQAKNKNSNLGSTANMVIRAKRMNVIFIP